MRGLLAAIVIVLGYVCVVQTLAYILRSAAPLQAQALMVIGDGRITAAAAQKLGGAETDATLRTRADALARKALEQDPTAVAAVSILGLSAQLRNDIAAARQLFSYAERLSRREILIQLWAIEDSVTQEDIPGVLRHYDIALRTSRRAPDLLFPILASAISDPKVRTALVTTFVDGAPWRVHFIDYASMTAAPGAAAQLFRDLSRRRITIGQEPQARVMTRLVADNQAIEAWNYYAQLHPGADRRQSRDPVFRANLIVPSPFDWGPQNDDMGIATSIQRNADGTGVFVFNAPSSIGGSLLRQVQILPPGNYRLFGHSSEINQVRGAHPYWVLGCSDGRELGRVEVPNSDQAHGIFAGRLTVPATCAVQILTLVARPSEDIGGLSGQIDRAALTPFD